MDIISWKEYRQNHERVKALFGAAIMNKCVDCDKRALDWSYIHNTDPANPINYEPRCRSCHQKYDYEPINELTKRKMSAGQLYNSNAQGVRNGKARLCESDVAEIRKMHASGISAKEIANQFKIDPIHIRAIIRRQYWAHVD